MAYTNTSLTLFFTHTKMYIGTHWTAKNNLNTLGEDGKMWEKKLLCSYGNTFHFHKNISMCETSESLPVLISEKIWDSNGIVYPSTVQTQFSGDS